MIFVFRHVDVDRNNWERQQGDEAIECVTPNAIGPCIRLRNWAHFVFAILIVLIRGKGPGLPDQWVAIDGQENRHLRSTQGRGLLGHPIRKTACQRIALLRWLWRQWSLLASLIWAPTPVDPWSQNKEALRFGNSCWQTDDEESRLSTFDHWRFFKY